MTEEIEKNKNRTIRKISEEKIEIINMNEQIVQEVRLIDASECNIRLLDVSECMSLNTEKRKRFEPECVGCYLQKRANIIELVKEI